MGIFDPYNLWLRVIKQSRGDRSQASVYDSQHGISLVLQRLARDLMTPARLDQVREETLRFAWLAMIILKAW